MGFSDIDLHTATLAPFLAEIEHGLQFVRISADEYNIIDEGQGSHPGATLRSMYWREGSDHGVQIGVQLRKRAGLSLLPSGIPRKISSREDAGMHGWRTRTKTL